jgi:hypothetical protein
LNSAQVIATATGASGEVAMMRRRVRDQYPTARFQAGLSNAQRFTPGLWSCDVWLDMEQSTLIALEFERSRPSVTDSADRLVLHQFALANSDCDTMLRRVADRPVKRLDACETGDTFRDVFTALRALEELFGIFLAQLRLRYQTPADVDRAIQRQIEAASTRQEVARRTAFRDWHLQQLRGVESAPVTPDDVARLLGHPPHYSSNLAQILGSWSSYQDTIFAGPTIDRWWIQRNKRRGTLHYYEFRAVDQPLSAQWVNRLSKAVPEGQVTSRTLTVELSINPSRRDFRWQPEELLFNHFDAGLQFDQSGWRTLWIRLPATLIDQVRPFQLAGAIEIADEGDHIVVTLLRIEEDGELTYIDTDPSPWLRQLLPIRDKLLAGDLRALQIAWDAADTNYLGRDKSTPPPVPAGMDDLTPDLDALHHFLTYVP